MPVVFLRAGASAMLLLLSLVPHVDAVWRVLSEAASTSFQPTPLDHQMPAPVERQLPLNHYAASTSFCEEVSPPNVDVVRAHHNLTADDWAQAREWVSALPAETQVAVARKLLLPQAPVGGAGPAVEQTPLDRAEAVARRLAETRRERLHNSPRFAPFFPVIAPEEIVRGAAAELGEEHSAARADDQAGASAQEFLGGGSEQRLEDSSIAAPGPRWPADVVPVWATMPSKGGLAGLEPRGGVGEEQQQEAQTTATSSRDAIVPPDDDCRQEQRGQLRTESPRQFWTPFPFANAQVEPWRPDSPSPLQNTPSPNASPPVSPAPTYARPWAPEQEQAQQIAWCRDVASGQLVGIAGAAQVDREWGMRAPVAQVPPWYQTGEEAAFPAEGALPPQFSTPAVDEGCHLGPRKINVGEEDVAQEAGEELGEILLNMPQPSVGPVMRGQYAFRQPSPMRPMSPGLEELLTGALPDWFSDSDYGGYSQQPYWTTSSAEGCITPSTVTLVPQAGDAAGPVVPPARQTLDPNIPRSKLRKCPKSKELEVPAAIEEEPPESQEEEGAWSTPRLQISPATQEISTRSSGWADASEADASGADASEADASEADASEASCNIIGTARTRQRRAGRKKKKQQQREKEQLQQQLLRRDAEDMPQEHREALGGHGRRRLPALPVVEPHTLQYRTPFRIALNLVAVEFLLADGTLWQEDGGMGQQAALLLGDTVTNVFELDPGAGATLIDANRGRAEDDPRSCWDREGASQMDLETQFATKFRDRVASRVAGNKPFKRFLREYGLTEQILSHEYFIRFDDVDGDGVEKQEYFYVHQVPIVGFPRTKSSSISPGGRKNNSSSDSTSSGKEVEARGHQELQDNDVERQLERMLWEQIFRRVNMGALELVKQQKAERRAAAKARARSRKANGGRDLLPPNQPHWERAEACKPTVQLSVVLRLQTALGRDLVVNDGLVASGSAGAAAKTDAKSPSPPGIYRAGAVIDARGRKEEKPQPVGVVDLLHGGKATRAIQQAAAGNYDETRRGISIKAAVLSPRPSSSASSSSSPIMGDYLDVEEMRENLEKLQLQQREAPAEPLSTELAFAPPAVNELHLPEHEELKRFIDRSLDQEQQPGSASGDHGLTFLFDDIARNIHSGAEVFIDASAPAADPADRMTAALWKSLEELYLDDTAMNRTAPYHEGEGSFPAFRRGAAQLSCWGWDEFASASRSLLGVQAPDKNCRSFKIRGAVASRFRVDAVSGSSAVHSWEAQERSMAVMVLAGQTQQLLARAPLGNCAPARTGTSGTSDKKEASASAAKSRRGTEDEEGVVDDSDTSRCEKMIEANLSLWKAEASDFVEAQVKKDRATNYVYVVEFLFVDQSWATKKAILTSKLNEVSQRQKKSRQEQQATPDVAEPTAEPSVVMPVPAVLAGTSPRAAAPGATTQKEEKDSPALAVGKQGTGFPRQRSVSCPTEGEPDGEASPRAEIETDATPHCQPCTVGDCGLSAPVDGAGDSSSTDSDFFGLSDFDEDHDGKLAETDPEDAPQKFAKHVMIKRRKKHADRRMRAYLQGKREELGGFSSDEIHQDQSHVSGGPTSRGQGGQKDNLLRKMQFGDSKDIAVALSKPVDAGFLKSHIEDRS